MREKNDKHPVCPNCFGCEFRQVLATATSRNALDDDPVTAPADDRLNREKRNAVVKVLCLHCGHELHRGGNRG